MMLPVAKSTDQSGSLARFCIPRSLQRQPTHSLKLLGVPTRPVSILTINVSSLGKPDVCAKTVELNTTIARHKNSRAFLVFLIVYLLAVFLSQLADKTAPQSR